MSTGSDHIDDRTLQDIAAKVDYLAGLFERRLLSDKDRTRAYNDLQARLGQAEAAAAGLHMAPLARELFLVVDRLDHYDGPGLDFVVSVADELVEAMRRHGIDQVDVSATFDPRSQEVAATRRATADVAVGEVTGIVRRGYIAVNGTVLRPAAVEVAVERRDDDPRG